MDLTFGSSTDGTIVQQYSCVAGNTNQRWTAKSLGDGSFNLVSSVTGKCLDLTRQNIPQESNGFQEWDCNGGSNQAFTFTPTAPGGYQISPVASPSQCLDVARQSLTQDNVQIKAWTCSGGRNQSYLFVTQ